MGFKGDKVITAKRSKYIAFIYLIIFIIRQLPHLSQPNSYQDFANEPITFLTLPVWNVHTHTLGEKSFPRRRRVES